MNLPQCLADIDNGRDQERMELGCIAGNGSISVVVYDEKWSLRKECLIWVMKEHGCEDSWTKLKISLGEMARPLGYWNRFKVAFILQRGKIMLYNTSSTEEREYIGSYDISRVMQYVGNYMASEVQF